MTRRRLLAGVAVVAALAIVGAIYAYSNSRPLLDLSRRPQTIFVTNPFEVGESYTLGSMAIPSDVVRPVTVSDVRVLETSGVEVVGQGLFDPATRSEGIGLVPGWPPEVSDLVDPRTQPVQWSGEVAIVVGLRTVEPKSGLRGIQVRWVDGSGRSGERVFDLAVLTCVPGGMRGHVVRGRADDEGTGSAAVAVHQGLPESLRIGPSAACLRDRLSGGNRVGPLRRLSTSRTPP